MAGASRCSTSTAAISSEPMPLSVVLTTRWPSRILLLKGIDGSRCRIATRSRKSRTERALLFARLFFLRLGQITLKLRQFRLQRGNLGLLRGRLLPRRIQLGLRLASLFGQRLLKKLNIALEAARAPLHGL